MSGGVNAPERVAAQRSTLNARVHPKAILAEALLLAADKAILAGQNQAAESLANDAAVKLNQLILQLGLADHHIPPAVKRLREHAWALAHLPRLCYCGEPILAIDAEGNWARVCSDCAVDVAHLEGQMRNWR